MQIQRIFFCLPAACCLLSSTCGPLEALRELPHMDVTPPVLLEVRTVSAEAVELSFDEECSLQPDSLRLAPPLEVRGAGEVGRQVTLQVGGQAPGAEYLMEAVAEDGRGNTLSFIARFYGFNPEVPALLVNELTPRGSGNHPDLVELRVMAAGNMGGVTLYQGTPRNWQDRLVFPAFAVAAGDFILVHFKPQGIPEEIDETEARGLSGGLDASRQAFDFWVREGSGLAGNNGVLAVCDRPGGRILDGLLYSNRTSASDSLYRGFGSREVLERAEELVRGGGWEIGGEQVRPEDGVNPEGSTGTRSLCRGSDSADTGSREDWHIVPTRGATFGRPNSDEVYSP